MLLNSGIRKHSQHAQGQQEGRRETSTLYVLQHTPQVHMLQIFLEQEVFAGTICCTQHLLSAKNGSSQYMTVTESAISQPSGVLTNLSIMQPVQKNQLVGVNSTR